MHNSTENTADVSTANASSQQPLMQVIPHPNNTVDITRNGSLVSADPQQPIYSPANPSPPASPTSCGVAPPSEAPSGGIADLVLGCPAPPAPAGDDSFSLAELAMPQNFAAMKEVETSPASAKIGKPNYQTWFLIHPDWNLRYSFSTLTDSGDKDATYVVHPCLASDLEGELKSKTLVPCISLSGALFLWPISNPDANAKPNSWVTSAHKIVAEKAGKWIRLKPDHEESTYRWQAPLKQPPLPEWPGDLEDRITRAVTAVLIKTLDHPIVKRLRGDF